jgi:Flp pilus assembly protein TadG
VARSRRRRARGERGASLVELAIVLPFLAVLVFGVIDLGRAWQLQNRLANASREGAAAIQFAPRNVDAGCAGGNNATDRAEQEEPGLTTMPGYAVTVAQVAGGVDTPYVGCGTATPALSLDPGQQVQVSVEATFDLITPLVGAIVGDSITVTRSTDVVVQG